MTFKTNDRVFETSTTVGTGSYALLGAQTGFQSFSVIGTGNTCPYFATDDTNWEVGIGTWTSGPSTLARTAVLASSTGGAVNWGGGITQKIRMGLPAAMAMPRTLSKSVAGAADVALTEDEQRRPIIELNGVLTGNINVTVNATPWVWEIYNNTTGAFTLTFKVTALTGVQIPQGARVHLYCDGTDVQKVASITAAQMGASNTFINGTLLHTRSGNAETIAIKAVSGGDPSPSDPVYVIFRGQSVSDPYFQPVAITAATSITISNGSTLGVAAAPLQFRIWIVGFNDGGTFRLGVINCITAPGSDAAGNWPVTQMYPLSAFGVASSTAEGGAGAADNSQAFYTGVAVTSKPYTVLGYSSWEAGLASNGVWASAPTRTQLFGPGVPLPGTVVQVQRSASGAVATGTTTVPLDDTIPQSGEGDLYNSVGMVPSAAVNLIRTAAKANVGTTAGSPMAVSLYRDAQANSFATTSFQFAATVGLGNFVVPGTLHLSQQTSTVTAKLRAGCSGAGTTTYNGSASARLYGGVYDSYIEQQEIMG